MPRKGNLRCVAPSRERARVRWDEIGRGQGRGWRSPREGAWELRVEDDLHRAEPVAARMPQALDGLVHDRGHAHRGHVPARARVRAKVLSSSGALGEGPVTRTGGSWAVEGCERLELWKARALGQLAS